jgi:cytochrome c1
MEERKRIGLQVFIYLIVLSVLVYICKERIWSRVDH